MNPPNVHQCSPSCATYKPETSKLYFSKFGVRWVNIETRFLDEKKPSVYATCRAMGVHW